MCRSATFNKKNKREGGGRQSMRCSATFNKNFNKRKRPRERERRLPIDALVDSFKKKKE